MPEQKETEAETAAESPPSEAGSARTPGPSAINPEERVAAAEAERNELRDRMLRLAAEFENYKKRVRREQAEADIKAKESVLRDFLEVADNLERALSVDEKADFKSLQKGVELVFRLLQGKLERHDVRPFDSKGEPFDPRVHDAVSQVPSPQATPGSVIGEVQKGYRIGERLLRPALVVVAAPSAGAAAPGGGSGAAGNGAAP